MELQHLTFVSMGIGISVDYSNLEFHGMVMLQNNTCYSGCGILVCESNVTLILVELQCLRAITAPLAVVSWLTTAALSFMVWSCFKITHVTVHCKPMGISTW